VAGLAVLAGLTRIKDPYANFHDIWRGSTRNPNALATSLVKTTFSFVGYHITFNVLNEVKSSSPVRTARDAGLISLVIVTSLYLFANVAYVAAVPVEEIKNSGQLVAALFFRHVFGDGLAAKTLPIMVALSCAGNRVSSKRHESYATNVPSIQIAVVSMLISYHPADQSRCDCRPSDKLVLSVRSPVKAFFHTPKCLHPRNRSGLP